MCWVSGSEWLQDKRGTSTKPFAQGPPPFFIQPLTYMLHLCYKVIFYICCSKMKASSNFFWHFIHICTVILQMSHNVLFNMVLYYLFTVGIATVRWLYLITKWHWPKPPADKKKVKLYVNFMQFIFPFHRGNRWWENYLWILDFVNKLSFTLKGTWILFSIDNWARNWFCKKIWCKSEWMHSPLNTFCYTPV